MMRLTSHESEDKSPVFTPEGKQVMFFSTREGTPGGIFSKAVDGTGKVEHLNLVPDRELWPESFSPDGKTFVISEYVGGMQGSISTLTME
jgi:Tol biopolymer transport system component